MNKEQVQQYSKKIENALRSQTPVELAFGYLRYEALRRLSARQFSELCETHSKAKYDNENITFDGMVDKLVVEGDAS
jgi:hypothetical protein